MGSLPYSYIDYTSPVPVPPPSLNGGLYTGQPFQPGAPWANIYVKPEADTYTQNAKSAMPPPNALMIPSNNRPGNNHVNQYRHHQPSPTTFNFQCAKLEEAPSAEY